MNNNITKIYAGELSNKRNKLILQTGTFFWVTTQTESFPRTPIDVIPEDLTALNAYSENAKY